VTTLGASNSCRAPSRARSDRTGQIGLHGPRVRPDDRPQRQAGAGRHQAGPAHRPAPRHLLWEPPGAWSISLKRPPAPRVAPRRPGTGGPLGAAPVEPSRPCHTAPHSHWEPLRFIADRIIPPEERRDRDEVWQVFVRLLSVVGTPPHCQARHRVSTSPCFVSCSRSLPRARGRWSSAIPRAPKRQLLGSSNVRRTSGHPGQPGQLGASNLPGNGVLLPGRAYSRHWLPPGGANRTGFTWT